MFQKDLCTRCGDCFYECQYMNFNREEAIEQITALINGESSKVLSLCATCTACNNICPEKANPFDLILERNEETEEMMPKAFAQAFFQTPLSMPSRVIAGDPGKPGLSLCTVERFMPRGIGGPMFRDMTVIKGGDYFCQMGVIHLGQKSMIESGLRQTVKNLADTGLKEIILAHDECYSALKNMCPEFGIEVPFSFKHILQYMLEYLLIHQDHIQKLDLTVGVQVACSTRYSPELEETLDQIFELIGVRRPRRTYEREKGLCCSVPLLSRRPGKAAQIREMNLNDIKEANASAMAALCPICIRTLANEARKKGLEIFMVHDLVRMALGETLPNPVFIPMDKNVMEKRFQKAASE